MQTLYGGKFASSLSPLIKPNYLVINHLGFFKYSKIIFSRAKIATELKRQLLTTPNIKNDTYFQARLFIKFQFEGFVLLRIFRSTLYENKPHKIGFFNSIFSLQIFFFDSVFDATVMTGNMQLFISAQRKIPTSFSGYFYPD